MSGMTPEQIEDFFTRYLAVFGIEGGRADFNEIRDWSYTGKYPNCFQKIWPMPAGKMYGYIPLVNGEAVASRLALNITSMDNYMPAIKSYREQVLGQKL